MSGARATICWPSAMMRSLPMGCRASSGKMSSPPARVSSSETQRMALMWGSSHSSKNTLGRRGKLAAARAMASSCARMSAMRALACSACPTMAPTW